MSIQESAPETQEQLIDRLQKDSNMLRCLEWAGVDNWSGYHYAYEIMRENFPKMYNDLFGGEVPE